MGAAARTDDARPEGGAVAVKVVQSRKDRLEGYLLVALIVLVQVVWAGALVYLGLHLL
jgi:hypothetical protein